MQSQQNTIIGVPALAVALDHPAFSTNPKVLCAAARACKAWREAVQQCSACNTDVTLDLNNSLLCMISFSDWLCKHSALVRSISVSAAYVHGTIHGLQQEVHYAAAQRLLQQSIQLATQTLTLAGPAWAAPAAAAQQVQQYGLRLVSFSSSCLGQPGAVGVLAALPAQRLTHLDLAVQSTHAMDGGAVSAALARLTSLQELHLDSRQSLKLGGAGCLLANVVQLRQLTSLIVNDDQWFGSFAALRQLLAQPLKLRQLHLEGYGVGNLALIDLTGMSHLVDLSFANCVPAGRLVMPTQLQELRLEVWSNSQLLSAILPLQQLQRLTLLLGFPEQQPLLQLAQLPALQHLALHYRKANAAMEAAASWAKLSQLRELHIASDDDLEMQPYQAATVLAGVAACSRLVKLQLAAVQINVIQADDAEEVEWRAVAACGKLTGLSTLRDLCLDETSELTPGDALALTALTGLTRLVLSGIVRGVGDVAATALACSLRELRHLDLQACDLGAMVCLAAIGQLKQLTELRLERNWGLTGDGLMLLTGLTRLQVLGVSRSKKVTDAAVDEFWAALQRQSRG